jgi:uncharacterized protein (DUF58 family)
MTQSSRSLRITTAGGMTLLLVVAGAQVWGRSGSAWLWLLVIGLVAILVLDGVASFVALRRVDLVAAAGPDAQVGRRDPIRVTVNRPVGRCLIRATSLADAPWVRVDAPETGALEVVPDRRGVFSAAEFEVVVRAPLGLVAVARRVLVTLPAPVWVAPAPDDTVARPAVHQVLDPERPGARADDLPRGVREYVPGDPRRQVHWPATARLGQLMVRDLAAATSAEVEFVVDLGRAAGPAAEYYASAAMAVGLDLMRHGYRVTLATREGVEVRGPVVDETALGRRLAAAEPGDPVLGSARAVRVGPAP